MSSLFKNNIYYLLGRFFLIGTRPLLLLFFIKFNIQDFSNILAEIFLIVSIGMLLVNFSAHREHYIDIQKKLNIDKFFKSKAKYLQIILFSLFWGLVVTLILSLIYNSGFLIFICSFLYFFVEKLHDEIQRFYLLKKFFSKWGKLNILKSIILITSFYLNYFFLGSLENFILFPIFNLIGYLAISIFYLKFEINFNKFFEFKKEFSIRKTIKNIYNLKILFLITSVSQLALYSERFYISFFHKNILDQVTLIAMVFSIIPTFLAVFFVQRKVKEFVSNEIGFADIFLSKIFYVSILSSFIFSWILIFVLNYFNLFNLNFDLIIVIFFIQFFYSLNMTMTELIYWKKTYKSILINELVYLTFFSLIFLFSNIYEFDLITGLICVLLSMIIKMLLYIFLILKSKN